MSFILGNLNDFDGAGKDDGAPIRLGPVFQAMLCCGVPLSRQPLNDYGADELAIYHALRLAEDNVEVWILLIDGVKTCDGGFVID